MEKTGDRKWLWVGVAVGVAYLAGPKLFAPLFALAGGLAALAFGVLKLGLVALGLYAVFSLVRGSSKKKAMAAPASSPSPAQVEAQAAAIPVDPETALEREHRASLAELDRELDRAIREKAMADARR